MFSIDFSFKFSGIGDLVTKREIKEERQGKSFLFSIILIGTVQI